MEEIITRRIFLKSGLMVTGMMGTFSQSYLMQEIIKESQISAFQFHLFIINK